MSDIKTIEGDFTSSKGKFTLVVGRWNSFVVEHLLAGAVDTLRRHGVDEKHITVVRAPGAFEIPLVCKKVAASGGVDAIIALAKTLKLRVIAEGIEDEYQLSYLVAKECDLLQGFYFARPIYPEDVPDMLRPVFSWEDFGTHARSIR